MTNLCPLVLVLVNQVASPTTLVGVVQDEAGRPVAGANVFVNTAAPRQGVGVL